MTAAAASPGRKHAGFTLIEVMVSLGVMTIGAMAILALQQHTIRSNNHARRLTMATQIAQIWIERLKQDAATWTLAAQATGSPSAAAVLANTRYLQAITANPNAFMTIPNVTATVSNAFDYLGHDIDNTTAQANAGANTTAYVAYCASMRLSWVYFGESMRADVRVWWPLEGQQIDNQVLNCTDDDQVLNPGGARFNDFHIVYLSTVLRVNPLDN